jgi:endonuclease YncB( thermonuclease family)
MVRAGEAVVYARGERVYDAEEREARTARRGIWAGTFQHPADFRRERR